MRTARLPSRGFAVFLMAGAGAVCVASACGGSPSHDEVNRSMKEFELAASLRHEGSLPGAIEHLRKALELDPKNARAHLLLGYIHMERKAFADAEPALRKGIALLEERDSDGSATLAEARNMLGVTLVQRGQYAEAVEKLKASAADVLNTQPHFAWGNLGLAHYRNKEYEAALVALSEAVRREPRFCLGHYLMGETYFAQKKMNEAEKALTRALEADPRCKNYQDALRLRGEVRARMGHGEDAIADLERCVELGPATESGQTCQRLLEAAH